MHNVNNKIGNNSNWKHNPQHRGGAPYPNRQTANKYGGASNRPGAANRPGGANGIVPGLEMPIDLVAEMPIGLVAEMPIGLVAEMPIDLVAEMPIDLVAEMPIGLVAERPIGLAVERPNGLAAEPPIGLAVEVLAPGQRLARPPAPTIWVTARFPEAPVRVIGVHSAVLLAK